MRTLLFVIALLLPASAYSDPVTGNIVVQDLTGKKASTKESEWDRSREVNRSELAEKVPGPAGLWLFT